MADGAYVELDRDGDAWLKLPFFLLLSALPPLRSLFLRPTFAWASVASCVPRYLLFQARRVRACWMGWDGTATNYALSES